MQRFDSYPPGPGIGCFIQVNIAEHKIENRPA